MASGYAPSPSSVADVGRVYGRGAAHSPFVFQPNNVARALRVFGPISSRLVMAKCSLSHKDVNEQVRPGFCRANWEFGTLSCNDALQTQQSGRNPLMGEMGLDTLGNFWGMVA